MTKEPGKMRMWGLGWGWRKSWYVWVVCIHERWGGPPHCTWSHLIMLVLYFYPFPCLFLERKVGWLSRCLFSTVQVHWHSSTAEAITGEKTERGNSMRRQKFIEKPLLPTSKPVPITMDSWQEGEKKSAFLSFHHKNKISLLVASLSYYQLSGLVVSARS